MTSSHVTIHECTSPIEVDTPMGRGTVWLIKDYGIEVDTHYTVIIKDGVMHGRIFDFPNWDIKVVNNYSCGRGEWSELKEKILQASLKDQPTNNVTPTRVQVNLASVK